MELGALLGCVLGLLIVAAVAILIIVLAEWGLNGVLGVGVPPIVFTVFRFILAILCIAWFLECVGIVSIGLHHRAVVD